MIQTRMIKLRLALCLSLAIGLVTVPGHPSQAAGRGPQIGATESEPEDGNGPFERNTERAAGSSSTGAAPQQDEPAEESFADMDRSPLAHAVENAGSEALPLHMLGSEIPPGSYRRLAWTGTELFEGIPLASPVMIVNGHKPGPTLCLTAAIHGDELNGIEMVRRVLHNLKPNRLSGAVIGVPIVNIQGFKSGTRYLPDRRDLNRRFPGNPYGSAASRIAHSFFTEIVSHCTALVDLHTGSFERANLPQLRADMSIPDVVTLTQGFGATVIINSKPASGTLRREATIAGIPTVTLEAGGPARLEPEEVDHGVRGIETLLNTLGMVEKISLWGEPEPVYYSSRWVRADRGGILLNEVELGTRVRKGDILGTITDPITNAHAQLYAPQDGRVIGLARNQVVMPGFAAYHLGIERAEKPRPIIAIEESRGGSTLRSPANITAVESSPELISGARAASDDTAQNDTDSESSE